MCAERVVGGRYTLIREIGRGGMAIVSLAHDARKDDLVALKMLREDIASAVNTERFFREIAVSAALRHPRILPLLGFGRDQGGLPFYVMPFVDGETLRDRVARQKQLPVDEALRIVLQIADALAFAHGQGVLHRDVTPANVLLSGKDAYLTDFGIARAVISADDGKLTSTGIVIGSPEYMSPEQGAGDPSLDGRSDLYSLASVLYSSIAGEPPFAGRSPQAVLARKATVRAPSVRQLCPTVPVNVERAIARGLEPVPLDRFQSMREFAAALAEPGPSVAPPKRRSWWDLR